MLYGIDKAPRLTKGAETLLEIIEEMRINRPGWPAHYQSVQEVWLERGYSKHGFVSAINRALENGAVWLTGQKVLPASMRRQHTDRVYGFVSRVHVFDWCYYTNLCGVIEPPSIHSEQIAHYHGELYLPRYGMAQKATRMVRLPPVW